MKIKVRNEKTINFIAGLPRSGSTLLCNLLNQNPDFYATPTSGLVGVIIPIKQGWHQIPAFKAVNIDQSFTRLRNVLRSVFDGYFADIDAPIVFDKNRAWLNEVEMLNEIFGESKFIVTVRDMRQVLASMEKLYRKTISLGIPSQMLQDPSKFATVESRALFWASRDQLVGSSYNAIRGALERGYKRQIHFVDYKALTKAPKSTMEALYNFLELPLFDHDFDNVVQTTVEDDRVHGFIGLHDIRSKVDYSEPDYNEILGKALADRFKGQELW